jgi:hypothetical protein
MDGEFGRVTFACWHIISSCNSQWWSPFFCVILTCCSRLLANNNGCQAETLNAHLHPPGYF